jgi:hypothetical protein
MADPDPNPNVTLAGSGTALHVQRPDGELVPVQGTAGGAIATTTTGSGGESLATEPTADRTADATEALAATIAAGGSPTPGQAAIAIVNVDPAPTFAAAPAEGTELEAKYIAGTAPFLLDRDSNPRPVFIEPSASEIATGVGLLTGQLPENLGASGGLKVELVAPLPTGTNPLGTVEVTASVLPIGAATEASLFSIDGKVPALVDGRVPVDGSGVTQPISATTLPLPSGAATSALQGAGLPGALTAGGGVKVGLVDAVPQLPAALDTGRLATRLDIGTEAAPIITRMSAYGSTSFGQFRVAGREPMFENTQTYGLDARAWSSRTASGGTVAYNTTSGVTELVVGATSGAVAEISTHTHFPYEPGAATRTVFTLSQSDVGQVGQTREWGFGTLDDGFFFRLVGTTLYVVRRSSSSGVATDADAVVQASWNGSTFGALDLTKINQFEIDFQWLSAGVVRFWINGTLAHALDLRGVMTLPATRTGQLPLRMTIQNTSASVAASLNYVCSVVYLDGGTQIKYVPGTHVMAAPKTGVGTTFAPVLGFRLATTYLGRANRRIVLPRLARVSNASGRGTVRGVFNPSATAGGAWAASPFAPWIEYNEGLTSITGGTTISEVYLSSTADRAEFDGERAFSLIGTHMRRNADNVDGDVFVFTAKADAGTIDIVSMVATFNTFG